MLMLFIAGKIKNKDFNKSMVLDDETVTFATVKSAIAYADSIGDAFVAQLVPGRKPNLIYETDTEG